MLINYKDFVLISIQIWNLELKMISELNTLVHPSLPNVKARTQVAT